MFARATWLCIVCIATTLVTGGACGTDPIQPTQPPAFAADPDLTIGSDAGKLTIEIRFAPRPPTIGVDAAQLTIRDATGLEVTGLGVSVVPWMPAHGHGTSVDPTVTETAPGSFVATPLYLFMPGSWELRMMIGGSVDDTAKAAFEIP